VCVTLVVEPAQCVFGREARAFGSGSAGAAAGGGTGLSEWEIEARIRPRPRRAPPPLKNWANRIRIRARSCSPPFVVGLRGQSGADAWRRAPSHVSRSGATSERGPDRYGVPFAGEGRPHTPAEKSCRFDPYSTPPPPQVVWHVQNTRLTLAAAALLFATATPMPPGGARLPPATCISIAKHANAKWPTENDLQRMPFMKLRDTMWQTMAKGAPPSDPLLRPPGLARCNLAVPNARGDVYRHAARISKTSS